MTISSLCIVNILQVSLGITRCDSLLPHNPLIDMDKQETISMSKHV